MFNGTFSLFVFVQFILGKSVTICVSEYAHTNGVLLFVRRGFFLVDDLPAVTAEHLPTNRKLDQCGQFA